MNIIFLDIDGVLNSDNFIPITGPATRDEIEFLNSVHFHFNLRTIRNIDPCAVRLIDHVAFKTNSQIVISSDWRLYNSVEDLESLLHFHGLTVPVIGRTPEIFDAHRGVEIQSFIDDLQGTIDSFVIFDDYDIGGQAPFLVRTDRKLGVTKKDANKALKILGK